MKTFELVVDRHGEEITRKAYGQNLEGALENLLKQCEEEDDTGIFFELADADLEYCRQNSDCHLVGDYGIVVYQAKEI